jgi:fido (protein-threonine AMPylation protein)
VQSRPLLIRTLERHRAEIVKSERQYSDALPQPLLVSWIHHDNMLEGIRFLPEEIVQAIRNRDRELPRYLHPLMEEIRRYESAIRLIVRWSKRDTEVVTAATLRRIHKLLTVDPRDWPGEYRRTSPVHRDYFQDICAPSRVKEQLEQTIRWGLAGIDTACDPVAFVAEIHHKLMHIYPYRRNPGTTLRLFTNLLLMSRGYPPVILQAHQRDAYYESLTKRSSDALAELFASAMNAYLSSQQTLRLIPSVS